MITYVKSDLKYKILIKATLCALKII